MASKKSKNITKRLIMWAAVVATLLMIPLLGNAPWTSGDFIFAGTVLFGCATIYEVITRNMKNSTHRIVVAGGVLFVVLLIWAWAVA